MIISSNIVGNGAVSSIVSNADGANIDAAGRQRISNPRTVFDNKQLYDNSPLFFDDQEELGSGTLSVHSVDAAASTLSVSALTAGKRTRQTFMRFNYQSGKSQLIEMTGVLRLSGGGVGIDTYIGPHDDNNGIYFRDEKGVITCVIRSSVSGSPVDNKFAQTAWNIDKMDGSGPSGLTLDPTKDHVFVYDFLWLAVDRVRVGLKINGIIYYVHSFNHANIINTAYMSTPNLPLRYQIENDGTGAASSLLHICSTVISEGGIEENGTLRYKSTEGVHLDANAADTLYAVIGMRLKAAAISCSITTIAASIIAETNDDFEWVIMFNPVIAGTFTYGDEINSCIQTALGVTANIVTGGLAVTGGMSKQDSIGTTGAINSARRLGAAIDGTPDEMVLCVRPFSLNADFQGSLTWRELS